VIRNEGSNYNCRRSHDRYIRSTLLHRQWTSTNRTRWL